MAELLDVSPDNIGLHLKNIYADGELQRAATAEESSAVQTEGGREVRRTVTFYNLDAILAVGYRVRSPRGVQFRRWASTVLAEYLRKGFVMDDERLKNPDGRPDYFDEMLARIRDIRASEKRFYQKVRDLFALAADYDKTDQATQQFFAAVQNILLYAVTQRTVAEKHGIEPAALKSFTDAVLLRMVFDGDLLGDLLAPQELGWKARTQKELALMEDMIPLFRKLAQGREISGLSAYEQ